MMESVLHFLMQFKEKLQFSNIYMPLMILVNQCLSIYPSTRRSCILLQKLACVMHIHHAPPLLDNDTQWMVRYSWKSQFDEVHNLQKIISKKLSAYMHVYSFVSINLKISKGEKYCKFLINVRNLYPRKTARSTPCGF